MTTEKIRKDYWTFAIITRGRHYLTERQIV